MLEELEKIREQLEQNPWRWDVAKVIAEIPSGHLATYKCIAQIANRRHGHNLIPRNIAWLRRHLYELLTHDTQVPLHRVMGIGDVNSCHDSAKTKCYNDRLRGQEGSLTKPKLWCTVVDF